MNLSLNKTLSKNYKNTSQKIRVISESWALQQIFCPSCGGVINEYINNKPVADFYCKKCVEDFELKSKKGRITSKVLAGSYSEMIKRINSSEKPNFFFMGYLPELTVSYFFVVPKHFFVPEIIEKRKPLAQTAQRAGWVGSNILFSKIPKAGQIFYIENGRVLSKEEILKKWQKTVFLKQIKKADAKGWILDIMNCIDELGKKEFVLAEIYAFEFQLKEIHPENNNIKAKIRQQLQLLRDKKYLEFKERGRYIVK